MSEVKNAYRKAFESQGIPGDLADECAQILVNDAVRDRTAEEQEKIKKAWTIATTSVETLFDPETDNYVSEKNEGIEELFSDD